MKLSCHVWKDCISIFSSQSSHMGTLSGLTELSVCMCVCVFWVCVCKNVVEEVEKEPAMCGKNRQSDNMWETDLRDRRTTAFIKQSKFHWRLKGCKFLSWEKIAFLTAFILYWPLQEHFSTRFNWNIYIITKECQFYMPKFLSVHIFVHA